MTLLCNGIQPGCDGVGDYSRLLSHALSELGHRCQLIAMNDPLVDRETEFISAGVDGDVRALRLPMHMSWSKKELAAKSAVRTFDPDWISLQFVCYGFHQRGLPVGLSGRLIQVIQRRKLHLMFHELWIGEADDYSICERVVGWLQKRIILNMIRSLKPLLIHTTNPVYVGMLAESNVVARELPLFGNVALNPDSGSSWFYEKIRGCGVEIDSRSRPSFLIAGCFGTIHPQWSPEAVCEKLKLLADERGQRLLFLAFGKLGASGEGTWDAMSLRCSVRAAFLKLGELTIPQLSYVLQNLDLGVSASAWPLIGKSGTIAAMLDHGLPVIVGRDEWHRRRGSTPDPTPHPLIFRERTFLDDARAGRFTKRHPHVALQDVVLRLVRELARVSNLVY